MKAYELLAKLRHLTLVGMNIDGKCDHQCSGNCRRVGCNCQCGEYHTTEKELEWVGTSKAWNNLKVEEEAILRDWEFSLNF